MAAWMLHGLCFGEEAGAPNLVFFRVKWLQPTMKGTSSVRRVRLRSFCPRIVPPMCFATSGCVATCVDRCGFATGCCETHCNGCMNVAWAMFWGGSRSTKPCVFPCKVVAADDERYTSSVRRVRLRSFCPRIVPPMCFATSGCVCVRSSMRFLNL